MPLTPGTRLGPYEVVAPLGAGGMGEVYRATDSRLRREVAIKVLPADVSSDPERLRRFEQEARAASALNHPNVLVVHDIGGLDGEPYVVTELLEGSTLREHLTGVPLPTSRAIAYALDVGRGLAAAHERGVVHRDIKPENLFITRGGHVKILDFGIATVASGDAAPGMTTKQGTEPGQVLGTVGYMSPEQVTGERVDGRSDLFALGVVLHEMLIGQAPFTRGSKIETLSAILRDSPPDLAAASPTTPPALARIVAHCLEKHPGQRFQSARDVVFALEGIALQSGATPALTDLTPKRNHPSRWVVSVGLAAAALAAATLLAANYNKREASLPPAARFEIPVPAGGALQGFLGVSSAISPDGEKLVMTVTTDTGQRLYVRRLDSLEARPLDGTEGAIGPFWSPDSRTVGYFSARRLQRIPADGGVPQTICMLDWANVFSTGSWAGDTILMAQAGAGAKTNSGSVFKVAATGGEPVVVAAPRRPQDGALQSVSFLPDGRHFLVSTLPSASDASGAILVGSLAVGGLQHLLDVSSRAVYAEPSHLLFVQEGTLVAQRFDQRALTLSGSPSVIADQLLYFRQLGQADFSVSRNGILAYQGGTDVSRLTWFRRDGSEAGQIGPADSYAFMRLAPDMQKVAVSVLDRRAGTTDIRLLDLTRDGQASAVTSDVVVDWSPVFSPDSQQIAFASSRRGPPHVHLKRLTDSGNGTELVAPSGAVQFVTDWAVLPDGEAVIYSDITTSTPMGIAAMPTSGKGERRVLVQSKTSDADGRVSPDGRSLAYVSTESGRSEVWVRSLTGPERWPVSSNGGVSPRWRSDGTELYYVSAVSVLPFGAATVNGPITAVEVINKPAFRLGASHRLFNIIARGGQFEPADDGRFLVNSVGGTAGLQVRVVLDWARGLPK